MCEIMIIKKIKMKTFVSVVFLSSFLSSVLTAPEKLPSVEEIIKKVTSTTKYTLGKCELDAKREGSRIIVDVALESCKLNLKDLIDHFYPSNDIPEKSNTFLVAESLFLRLEIDIDKKSVEFQAKSPTKFDLISDLSLKNKLSVSEISISMKYRYDKTFTYENLEVKMTAKLKLGTQEIAVKFDKEEGENKFSFQASTNNVSIKLSVKDLVAMIGVEEKIKEMFGEETLRKKIVDFEMEKIGLEGVFDPATYNLELVVSGTIESGLAKKVDFYFVIVKVSGEPYKIAVAAKLESIELLRLVEFIIGKKPDIEFLKGKSLDAIVLAANDDIILIENKDLAAVLKDVPKVENAALPKGPTVTFNFTQTKDEGSEKESNIQLYMRYADKKFQFKFIPSVNIELLDALKQFTKKAIDVDLPKWLGELSSGMNFDQFSFDLDGSINMQIALPQQLTLGSVLKIQNTKFDIFRKSNLNTWEFSLESITLISKDVSLKIGVKKSGDAYELAGSIMKISLKELLKYLVSDEKYASGDFERFNLDLKDVTLKWRLSESEPAALKLLADVEMENFEGVKFEMMVMIKDNKPEWKIGFFVPKVELCDMMKSFFGKDVDDACWIKNVDYALAMDGIKSDVEFSLTPLKGIPKQNKGFYFKVRIEFPKDCKEIQLCKKGKELMKKSSKRAGTKSENVVILLEGVIFGKSSFKIAAKLQVEEKLSESVTLNEYELILDMDGPKGSVYYGVKVNFDNKKDRFDIQGRIGLSTDGDFSLTGSLKGDWANPFGLKSVVIHKLFLKIAVNIGVLLPSLEFAGEVTIGRPESKKKIEAAMDMSISLTNINDIFFYSKVNRMTVDEILDLFELSAPKVLKETGFPNGFTVAFTLNPAGSKLDALDKTIDPGLTIIGDVNLFGLQLSCKITIDTDMPKFLIFIQFDVINLELISFSKVNGKPHEGPVFRAQISPEKKEVMINAQVTVLGISVGTDIQVTDSHYVFTVKGKVFNLIQAELTCKAKYGDLKNAEFTVAGKLKFGKELEEEITSQVDETKRETQAIMDETTKALKNIERMGQTQKESESRYKQRMLEVQEEITKDVNDIKKLAEIKDCVKKCKKVTLGGVIWKENCILVADSNGKKEYVGCPEWKDDLYSYPDLGCIAECKGEGFLDVFWADTKQLAARVSDSVGESIDSAINFFKEVWDKVGELVDFAKELYEKVKDVVKAGLDILVGAIGKVIDFVGVTEASFETSLKAAATAEIELAVKVKTKEYKIRASLRGDLLKKIGETVIEHVHEGYKDLKHGFIKAKGYISDIAAKMGIVEKEIEKAKSKKDSSKTRKRSYVPTMKEMEIKRLIYDPLPRPTLSDNATVQVFENFKPERFMSHNSIPREKKFRNEDITPSRKHTINALMNSDSCTQLKFVMEQYSTISNILKNLKVAYFKQEKKFRSSATEKRNKLKKIGKSFREKCSKTPGCNEERLKDVLFYVRKTRDATTKWVKAVRSKINKQNKEAFNIWRENLDHIFKRKRGMSIKDFANEMFTTTISRADTRSKISKQESSNLSLIAEHVGNLFDEGRPLTIKEAYPTIVKLNRKVEELVRSPQFLGECKYGDN